MLRKEGAEGKSYAEVNRRFVNAGIRFIQFGQGEGIDSIPFHFPVLLTLRATFGAVRAPLLPE